jgi:DNA invertase Pin-like site-specific DNA recombinase
MRIGIYNRKDQPQLPTLEWLIKNDFDSYDFYDDRVENEFDDLSEREGLNMLLYDAEYGHLDAVYVHDLKVFSSITVKVLQAIIEIQKLKLPIYYSNGCIYPSDISIKVFQDQMTNKWEEIKRQTKDFDFNKFDHN